MLLHIRPQFLIPSKWMAAELIDLRVEPLGLYLRGHVDLTVRRPWPNKRWQVVCRKIGNKALLGLLIETAQPVQQIQYIARWAFNAEKLFTHIVTLAPIDDEFDAISDHQPLWFDRRPPELIMPPILAVEPYLRATAPGAKSEQTYRIPTIERARIVQAEPSSRIPLIAHAFHAA